MSGKLSANGFSDFNFEPVNAESWLPNGQQAWDLIRSEIDASEVFGFFKFKFC
jgi:hypothetical protein